METDSQKWVGSSCGLHGPYIFYKAFKFHRDGKARILSLGDFFLVRCTPEDPICIAELQLLWEERTTKQLLSSSKLYFLPEDTPAGRTVNHGEDEVVGVAEKVVLRLENLVKWTAVGLSGWACGRRAGRAVPGGAAMPKMAVLRELGTNGHRDPHLGGSRSTHTHPGISFRDVQREKAQIGEDEEERTKVTVLSYPQYCRYRSVLARLRGGSEVAVMTERIVRALGGMGPLHGDVRVLYCRETFQHPTLGHNESVCEHFAPNLKGRPRKRKLSQHRDSQNQNHNPNPSLQTGPQARPTARTGSEPRLPPKVRTECRVVVTKVKTGGTCKRVSTEEKREGRRERQKEEKQECAGGREGRRARQKEEKQECAGGREGRRERQKEECGAGREGEQTDEEAFLRALDQYMRRRKTPIERIPYLGFKQINLWMMFQTAQRLGGYQQITARRQWKLVYDELGGHPGSTSAATCTRRHYERLLLPYERHSNGQEKGQSIEPLPIQAEPVSIPGSEDKSTSPSSRRSRAGRAPVDQKPQVDAPISALPDDRGVSQHSLHQKDISRNRKIKKKEKEEELQPAGKQKETPATQANHHVNQQSAHPISLQTNQAPSPSSLSDPPGGLSHQSKELSRSGLSKVETLEPQAHRQATSPGHHPLQPLGVLEPHMVGRIPEKDSQPLFPVKEEVAQGSTPGSLNGSIGSDISSPNSHGAPSVNGSIGSDISSPNAQTGPYFNSLHGVMSPLAKKKLLSQVCAGGGCDPQNYPALPLVAARSDVGALGGSRTGSGGGGGGGGDGGGVVAVARALDLAGREGAPIAHPASPETAPAPRPSVIQHAQSFRPPLGTDDERPIPAKSCPRQEPPLRGQLLPQPPSKLSPSPDPSARGMESQGSVQRTWAESPGLPPHASGCRGQVFYSSPHLQSLYRHAKHRLSQQHRQQHLGSQVQGCQHLGSQVQGCQHLGSQVRQGPQRGEMGGVAQNVPDVLIDEKYSTPPPPPHFGCRSSKTPFARGPFGGQIYPTMHRDCRAPAPIQPGLDTRGIASTRFPVPIKDASASYKVSVPGRVGGIGGARPCGGLTQNPEAVRAPKRPLEDEESRAPPAKTRPLSPPHPSTLEEPAGSGAFGTREGPAGSGAFGTREGPAGSGACSTRMSERQGEEAEPPEPSRAVHLNSYSSQGLRYAPHARHLGGLCPVGTFGAQEACEGPRAVGYPPLHPLAFLKSHGVAAPDRMAPPKLVLPALMMQGQLVISPTPTSLRQASSAHGLYPLRPFHPPHTYPTLQLPALRPNTEL